MPAQFQESLVSRCLINLNAKNVPFFTYWVSTVRLSFFKIQKSLKVSR